MSLIGRRSILSIAIFLVSLYLPLSSTQAQEQDPSVRQRHGWLDPTVREEYKKWLNEDVRYIISHEERTDFKKLLSDRQRDDFVVAFWERRNPTPGAPDNKFKEQHYQRLAYTNQHFTAGIPGWKTDRGRIYIVYGAPDEIESHPRSGRLATPQADRAPADHYSYEVWHYPIMKGIGENISLEFVDTCECGDYRLTLDPSRNTPQTPKDE